MGEEVWGEWVKRFGGEWVKKNGKVGSDNFYFQAHHCLHPISSKLTQTTPLYSVIDEHKTTLNTIQYNTIQYKHDYYYSGINPVEFRKKYNNSQKSSMKQNH